MSIQDHEKNQRIAETIKELESERTYTYAEMLANQAAALREGAEIADRMDVMRQALVRSEIAAAILALTTDQLALDRRDAELRASVIATCQAMLSGDTTRPEYQEFKIAVMKRDSVRDVELKAQTVAMLEKAARLVYEAYSRGTGQVKFAASESANNIRALIPTDYSAALAERVREAVREPIEALSILYEETADYIRINNLGDVHHNRSMQYARDVLAAHRAAAGAPEEKKA